MRSILSELRGTCQILPGLTALFLCGQALAQPISPCLTGVNVWHNPDNTVWNVHSRAGHRLIRIGGGSADHSMPSRAQLTDWVNRIKAMGAQPLIQVSQYQSAQAAADLVRYFNIETNNPVRFWNIGNEPWLQAGRPAMNTMPGRIAAYVRPAASAMKAVDPSIRIFIANMCYYEASVYRELFNSGGPHDLGGRDPDGNYYVDGASWHRYNSGEAIAGAEDIIASIRACQENIAAANIRHGRSGDHRLTWGIGEWNANAGTGAPCSFGTGQMVGAVLGAVMRYEGTFATMWSMFENGGQCKDTDFSTIGNDMKPRATFKHMQLVSQNMHGEYAHGTTTLNPDIFAYGSTSATDVTAMIINRGTIPRTFTLRLDSGVISGDAVNINAGVNVQHAVTIAAQTTLLLVFTPDGELAKRFTYSSSHYDRRVPPTLEQFEVTPRAPEIIAQPRDATMQEGETATFTVVARGTSLVYQWLRSGEPVAGGDGPTLTLKNVSLEHTAATYTVRISNALGSVTSSPALLTVHPFTGPQIPKLKNPIVSDLAGNQAWAGTGSLKADNVVLGSIVSGDDLQVTFKVLWEERHLYVQVTVTDDRLFNQATQRYENDGVEIFIDLTNKKSGSYGSGDFHYRFVWADSTVENARGGSTDGMVVTQHTTPDGYVMECALPWETLGHQPQDGELVGFDVQVNDNDGAGREGKLAWFATNDNAWQDPSVLGTVRLASEGSSAVRNPQRSPGSKHNHIVTQHTCAGLMVRFPSPADYRIEMVGASGRVVAVQSGTGSRTVLDTRHMASGIYLVAFDRPTGRLVRRIVLP